MNIDLMIISHCCCFLSVDGVLAGWFNILASVFSIFVVVAVFIVVVVVVVFPST